MSSNVGLSTPRGSGTSGYVQKNLSHLKPRDRDRPTQSYGDELLKHKQRNPDPEILEHERKRKIEVKVFELRDKLEEEGVDEDEIDDQIDAYRRKLEQEDKQHPDRSTNARGLKSHQVHDLAKAKIEETEKVRRAFGISKDYEEGSHWKRQEERKREADEQKLRDEEEAELERPRERKYRDRIDDRRRGYRDRDGERHGDRRSWTPEDRSRSPSRDYSD